MGLSIMKALIVIDQDMQTLQAWLDSTNVNSIYAMTSVGGAYLLILYS